MLSLRWDRATMVRETVKAYTTRLPPPGSFNTILIITILSILISISIIITIQVGCPRLKSQRPSLKSWPVR